MKQPAPVDQVQLGHLYMPQGAIGVANTKVQACNLDGRVGQPFAGNIQPEFQVVSDGIGNIDTFDGHHPPRSLVDRQFQPVGVKISEHNAQAHERGEKIEANADALQ